MGVIEKVFSKQINEAVSKQLIQLYPGFISATNSDSNFVKLLTSDYCHLDTSTPSGQWKAYEYSSVIQTIIDRLIDYTASGKLIVVNDKGEPQETPEAKEVLKLLNNPNPLQNYAELEGCMIAYMKIYGCSPLLKVYPSQRQKGLPTTLWAVDRKNFDYKFTGKYYSQNELSGIIESILITSPQGGTQTYSGKALNNIWVINGRTLRKDDIYTAESPLYALQDSINEFQIAVNVYGNLLERSVLGIISNKTNDKSGFFPIGDKEKENIKSKLAATGLTKFKDNYIVSDKQLFFQSMATNMGSLAIPEALSMAVNNICDKLHFAPELLAEKDATYENQKVAEIRQYQNDIIPNINHILTSLTEFLIPNTGLYIRKDFSHLPIMQKDKSATATTFKTAVEGITAAITAGLITIDEGKDLLEEMA